jgi:hypothetical protein
MAARLGEIEEMNELNKYCTVTDMNWPGEIMHGTHDGTYYVLDDGDCYTFEMIIHYDVKFYDTDPRTKNNPL